MTIADTATPIRAESAYAHLASFRRGDLVDVGGRAFFLPGTVTATCIENGWLTVTGDNDWIRVTVADLLSGKHTITLLADAKAGNVRYFDAADYAIQNPEG
jgi:hypothetical protein